MAVVIAFWASVWGVPAWGDEATQVRVLLTKCDDGDTRDAKLRSATGPGKYDEHQDDDYVLLREGATPVLRHSPAQPIRIRPALWTFDLQPCQRPVDVPG